MNKQQLEACKSLVEGWRTASDEDDGPDQMFLSGVLVALARITSVAGEGGDKADALEALLAVAQELLDLVGGIMDKTVAASKAGLAEAAKELAT